MGIAITFGVSGMILLFHPLAADLKIDGTPPPTAVIQAPAPLAAPEAPVQSSPAPRRVARMWAPIAAGFGRDVPLEFAVRQIAPSWLHVSYGDGVNGQARVSWHGGRPWNQVLGNVLTPLGLHMKLYGRTLWIRG